MPPGDRIEDIATLYNGLAKDETSLYGVQVRDAYERRLWEKPDGDYGEPADPSSIGLDPVANYCFSGFTRISHFAGESKPIAEIVEGDIVLP